jgi:hypothetical protein
MSAMAPFAVDTKNGGGDGGSGAVDPFFDSFVEHQRPLLEHVLDALTHPPRWIREQQQQQSSSRNNESAAWGPEKSPTPRLLLSLHLAPAIGYHWRALNAYFNARHVESARCDRWRNVNPHGCIAESNYERLTMALIRAFQGFRGIADSRYINIVVLPILAILFIRHTRSCSLVEAERAYYGDEDFQYSVNQLFLHEQWEPELKEDGLLGRPLTSIPAQLQQRQGHLLNNPVAVREYCKQRARQELEQNRARKRQRLHRGADPTRSDGGGGGGEDESASSSSIATATTTLDASESTVAMGHLASALLTNLAHL